jgi:hypothetical protein
MANQWRILRSAILLSPEKVKQLTSTIITLHNFLMPSPESAVPYIPANLVDVDVDVEDKATGIVSPGLWHTDASPSSWLPYKPGCSNNYSADAKAIREEYYNTLITKVLCIGNGFNVPLIKLYCTYSMFSVMLQKVRLPQHI